MKKSKDLLGDLTQCLIIVLCLTFIAIGGFYIYHELHPPSQAYIDCMTDLSWKMRGYMDDRIFKLMDSYCNSMTSKRDKK